MEIRIEQNNLRRICLFLLAGFGAGFVNGLAGTGAGVVFLLFFGIFGGGMDKTVFSLSMACVVPLSVISLLTYPPPAADIPQMLPWIFLSSVLGGLCGAWIQKKVQVKFLKWAFAALVVYAGLHMLL